MSEELTWDETQSAFKERLAERKTIEFELPQGTLRFTIRMLKQHEFDTARSKMKISSGKKKGSNENSLDMGDYNREKIRFGVVSGPKGFSAKNPAHVQSLELNIRDELAQAIEDFSDIPEVIRISFRGSGEEGKETPGNDK